MTSDSLENATPHGNCPDCGAGYVESDGRTFCVECGDAKEDSTDSEGLPKITEPFKAVWTLGVASFFVLVGVAANKIAGNSSDDDPLSGVGGASPLGIIPVLLALFAGLVVSLPTIIDAVLSPLRAAADWTVLQSLPTMGNLLSLLLPLVVYLIWFKLLEWTVRSGYLEAWLDAIVEPLEIPDNYPPARTPTTPEQAREAVHDAYLAGDIGEAEMERWLEAIEADAAEAEEDGDSGVDGFELEDGEVVEVSG